MVLLPQYAGQCAVQSGLSLTMCVFLVKLWLNQTSKIFQVPQQGFSYVPNSLVLLHKLTVTLFWLISTSLCRLTQWSRSTVSPVSNIWSASYGWYGLTCTVKEVITPKKCVLFHRIKCLVRDNTHSSISTQEACGYLFCSKCFIIRIFHHLDMQT